jgi:hypothetical protein
MADIDTVRIAPELSVDPAALVATARKESPLRPEVAPEMVSVAEVVPPKSESFARSTQTPDPAARRCQRNEGDGVPPATTVNEVVPPSPTVAAAGWVLNVGREMTETANNWSLVPAAPLEALMPTSAGDSVAVSAVPLITPVAALKAKPAGSVPETRLKVGVGKPEAATVKDPAVPAVKETAEELVNAGGWRTFNVPAAEVTVPEALVATALNW